MKRILSLLLVFMMLFSISSYAAKAHYPEKHTLEIEKGAVLETGNTVKFKATIYPEETTERRLHWMVIGGNAITNQKEEK